MSLIKEMTFTIISCGGCGINFGIPDDFLASIKRHRTGFTCPRGCNRVFLKENTEERLRREKKNLEISLIAEKDRADMHAKKATVARRSARAYKGQVTKIKNRVGNGVCPCCNRTFINLGKHMKGQHPTWNDGGTR